MQNTEITETLGSNGRPILQGSPKKLPAGRGWGVLAGPGGQPGDTVQVTTRRGKTWQAILAEEVQYGVWATEDTEERLGSTRERLENRADKREDWAEGRHEKGEKAWEESRKAIDGIPLGQRFWSAIIRNGGTGTPLISLTGRPPKPGNTSTSHGNTGRQRPPWLPRPRGDRPTGASTV